MIARIGETKLGALFRGTVRWRLTLLYGTLFLFTGAVLLAITYLLVERTFPVVHQETVPVRSGLVGRLTGGLPSPNGFQAPSTQSGIAALVSRQRHADLHQLLVESSIALGIVAVASLALGWIIAGRFLRPLRTITSTTRQISEESLHKRLALEGPDDELKQLGDTIDGLLGRLEGAFAAHRRFVANVSHELRTPVTVGRTLLEMILGDPTATIESLRATCEDVLETEKQQERLIEALLTLARSHRGLDHLESVDLALIASEVARAHTSDAAVRGVALDASVCPAIVSGDHDLIERLVTNLVENALRYNVPDGSVHVGVETAAGQAILTVANTGPPVPSDQIDRLLLPFRRLAKDRIGEHEGLGLGLSIVRAIADAHGALLEVRPGEAGGLHINIRFSALRVALGSRETASRDSRGTHPERNHSTGAAAESSAKQAAADREPSVPALRR